MIANIYRRATGGIDRIFGLYGFESSFYTLCIHQRQKNQFGGYWTDVDVEFSTDQSWRKNYMVNFGQFDSL
jgi:hypothetical protein